MKSDALLTYNKTLGFGLKPFSPAVVERSVTQPFSWCDLLEFLPVDIGSPFQTVFCSVRLTGSPRWHRIRMGIPIPLGLSPEDQISHAISRYKIRLKPHAFLLWAQPHLRQLYPNRINDPSWKRYLRNLIQEFSPYTKEGRGHLQSILNLPDFESTAFPLPPSLHEPVRI